MSTLKSFWSFLDGKKTYLIALGGFILWLGWVFSWWTWDQIDQLFVLLGTLGLATLRAGISK